MRRWMNGLLAIGIVAGAVLLATFLVWLAPEPEQRELPSPLPFVTTAAVTAGTGVIPVYGAGTVRPSAEIDIAPQVGGRIVWVNPALRSGGRIETGQTMFRIEEADYVNRLTVAEAALAERRVSMLEAEEEAAIARDEFERFSSRQEDSGLVAGAGPLALHEPQLAAARAALERDQARVADAELALARTRVNAPFNGFVRDETVDAGQVVAPGQSLGRLFAADEVEVVAPLADSKAALIPDLWQLGAGGGRQRVAARVTAQFGAERYAWDGYVDRADASVDDETRTIDVIVRVPEPFSAGLPEDGARVIDGGPPLLVGKFVDVEISGLAPERYFRLRRAALQPGNEVWIVGAGGAVAIVPVRLLQRGDDEVFVTGDLEDGQAAITSGIQFATNGMRVRAGEAPGS